MDGTKLAQSAFGDKIKVIASVFIKDDTSTSGRVYAKMKSDRSYLLWGDFKTESSVAKLATNTRALYGAKIHVETNRMAADDKAIGSITAYAAQPETLDQTDLLRGTGGSIYFLSRQDINGGSESVAVQFVSPTTGRIVDQRKMQIGVDYDIDYLQGMLLLRCPCLRPPMEPRLQISQAVNCSKN